MILEKYAIKLKRVKEFINNGWYIWDVDIVREEVMLAKEENGKKFKKIKLTDEELIYLKAVAEMHIQQDEFLRNLGIALIEELLKPSGIF